MDLVGLHTLCGLLSITAQMVAIIIVVSCAIKFFSLKPGGSLKFVFFSLLYFFSSTIILFVAAQHLMNMSRLSHSLGGVMALMGGSLLHLSFGIVIIAFYIRNLTL